MATSESPFREEDLAGRITALLTERDALIADIGRARAAAAPLTPWSWGRFLLGLVVLPVGLLLLVSVVVR